MIYSSSTCFLGWICTTIVPCKHVLCRSCTRYRNSKWGSRWSRSWSIWSLSDVCNLHHVEKLATLKSGAVYTFLKMRHIACVPFDLRLGLSHQRRSGSYVEVYSSRHDSWFQFVLRDCSGGGYSLPRVRERTLFATPCVRDEQSKPKPWANQII